MSEFYDFDPISGLTYKTEFNEAEQVMTIRSEQDCQPILDHMARVRSSDKADTGIKNDWWFYCTIPPAVELALLQRGININKKGHLAKALKVIDSEYPHLKSSRKRHVIKEH